MGIGRGTTTTDPKCGSTTPGAPKCVALFIFYFSLFYIYRTLSGGEPAELMMQQPGRDKGCDEHSGGLHYEH